MKKRFLTVCLACALVLSACSGGEGAPNFDPSNPVSLTVWHYYNGSQQVAFDELVAEFNNTVGKEKGIYVEGHSKGSVADLELAILDSAAGVVGAEEMPDLFSTYADIAYDLERAGKLADLSSHFSDEELSQYISDYIREGYFHNDGALYLFPVAKSTEILMLNTTDWDVFAAATCSTVSELATTEGVTAVAKRYYEWTDSLTPDIPDDGKAFYGRDSLSNYFLIGMKQMGIDLFDVSDGTVTIRAEKDAIRRLWDNYYVPYVSGWFASFGKFRSDDVKTGDILAYTGSTSSSMYFPNRVVPDSESFPIEYAVLPAPVMAGGENVNVQQGASMAVTKSDELHEYAACEFLRWFTAKENNLRFVCESSYLPVRKEAYSLQALDEVIASHALTVDSKAYDCLKSVLQQEDVTYYTTKCFANGYDTRKVLDECLQERAVADKAQIDARVAAGESRAEVTAQYVTDETFEAWYREFCILLNEQAHS